MCVFLFRFASCTHGTFTLSHNHQNCSFYVVIHVAGLCVALLLSLHIFGHL